jgi:hypothetical protein
MYDAHVVRRNGRWTVAVEGARRPLSRHASVDEAVSAARSWSLAYGSQVIVHRAPGASPTADPRTAG